MKYIIAPTFDEFSKCNDWYMLKINRKPRNPVWIKAVFYPFVVLFCVMIIGVFLIWLAQIKRQKNNQPDHVKNRGNYRKVVKEGFLWDSIEYHER